MTQLPKVTFNVLPSDEARAAELIFKERQTLLHADLAAERFAIWLALAPCLHDLATLNQDNDDGHVTGFEITLFLRRIHAALESIGQGLHRFDGEAA